MFGLGQKPIQPCVLVVDDDPSVRRPLERALCKAGFCVEMAIDVASAVTPLVNLPVAAVVLDMLFVNSAGRSRLDLLPVHSFQATAAAPPVGPASSRSPAAVCRYRLTSPVSSSASNIRNRRQRPSRLKPRAHHRLQLAIEHRRSPVPRRARSRPPPTRMAGTDAQPARTADTAALDVRETAEPRSPKTRPARYQPFMNLSGPAVQTARRH